MYKATAPSKLESSNGSARASPSADGPPAARSCSSEMSHPTQRPLKLRLNAPRPAPYVEDRRDALLVEPDRDVVRRVVRRAEQLVGLRRPQVGQRRPGQGADRRVVEVLVERAPSGQAIDANAAAAASIVRSISSSP